MKEVIEYLRSMYFKDPVCAIAYKKILNNPGCEERVIFETLKWLVDSRQSLMNDNIRLSLLTPPAPIFITGVKP